jgi:hypothetical protein
MAVLMFQPQFADKVESGQKRQTIRPPRQRPIKVGDKLSLRKWSSRPYGSKQVVLRESVCVRVQRIVIRGDGGISQMVEGEACSMRPDRQEQFAIADGFASSKEMIAWFSETHGLPFEGVLIQW